MLELITKCLEERSIQKLLDFPEFLKSDWEKKIITYIADYSSKFGEVISVSRLQREFPSEFTPMRADPPLPLLDVYELELEAKRSEYAIGVLSEALSKVKLGEKIPTADISAMVEALTMSSASIVRYTTFDRESYFRTGDPLKTGLRLIDRVTGGIYPGEFMVLIGRLGTGKSTWEEFFMNNWFLEGGKRILHISKEMPPADVFARLDAMVGKFNSRMMRDPSVAPDVKRMLSTVKAVITASKGEIIMPILPYYEVSQIKSLARNSAADAIIIDGLYHLSSGKHGYSSGWEEIKAVSGEVKSMALELHKPVMATTQIKRGAKGDVYDAEDIAYSDAIGQDADFILAIKNIVSSEKKRAELQLIKNRYGPEITTIVETDYDTMSYREVSVAGAL